MADVLKIALDYIALGWAPIPIPFKTKQPVVKKWQELRITKSGATQHFNSAPQNIGVLMGAPSAGLTDVDLDCPEAVAAAPFFLTPTHCFGRPSKRCSHWPYITDLAETDDRATLKFTDVQKPERVILEIRTGGGGHAAQTVFPGSVHPSGETIAWEGKPPSSNTPLPKGDGEDLKQRAAKIAACALLAQNYPKAGGRHEGAIVVTGFLCRCGFPAPAIKIFIEALAVATCQPPDKRKDMIKTAGDMAAGSAGGKHTYGFKKLEETFSKPVAQKCAEWLGYKAEFRPGVDGESPSVLDFIRGDVGQILNGHHQNPRRAISMLGVKLKHDEFSNQPKIWGLPGCGGGGQELTDAIAKRLRFLIEETYSFLPSKDLFEDVLIDIAHQNRFHPARDYLDGLTWDGVPRIDNWLHAYGGAEDTPFNRAVGRIFLIAAVRRVRRPGCKFDTMLVLESPTEGKNKSQAVQLLAAHEEWFTDHLPLGADPKIVIEQCCGSWIIECAELTGIATRELDRIKAFLSRQRDKARAAYGRRSETVPRQFVCFGTTNDREYLKNDERRLWPVLVKKFDLAALGRDVPQLWAEAAHYEADGEPITLQEDLWEAAADVRAARRFENPYYAPLAEHFSHKPWMTSKRVWAVLNIKPDQQFKARRAVGEALEALGFVRHRATKKGVPEGCLFDAIDEPSGCLRDEYYYYKLEAKP